LRDEATRIGLDGDVLDRLARLIPTLTTTTGPADVEELDDDPPADVLDPSTRRQIRGALEHLGRRDLYDALGLFRDAPASIITARADEERQRWMRKAQVTAEKTAWLEIIAHAQSHLTSTRARARYDRTLLLEAEESFDAVTVFALQGGLRRALASWSVSTPGRAQPLPQEPGHRGRLARDALAGLNRCPPDAPTGLEMQVLRDRVRLSWTPPPPDGLGPLTFAVMRKRGGLPQHPGDGTRIAEVSACEFEDRHLKPGETISYAVLAKRGEAESMTAVAVGPLVYLPDVQDVRVEPRAGEIELSWIPPHGVFEIRVVRKCGSPPAGPRDGERIAASLDQAVDSGLREEQVYHYAIYAIYRMADLRRYPSQGIVVAAFPRLPPPPMNAPRLMIMPSGHVRLDWTETREVPCGFSARQGLHPLLQEPNSASLLASNLRETGLRSRAPTGPRTPTPRQPASATTRLWSWSEACSPSAIQPRSREWPIPRNSEPPGPADRVKRHRPQAGSCCGGAGRRRRLPPGLSPARARPHAVRPTPMRS
jgi:hypothetical protein